MLRRLLRLSISDAMFTRFYFSTKVVLLRSSKYISLRRSATFVVRKLRDKQHRRCSTLTISKTQILNIRDLILRLKHFNHIINIEKDIILLVLNRLSFLLKKE
jgi:hypothetical protein